MWKIPATKQGISFSQLIGPSNHIWSCVQHYWTYIFVYLVYSMIFTILRCTRYCYSTSITWLPWYLYNRNNIQTGNQKSKMSNFFYLSHRENKSYYKSPNFCLLKLIFSLLEVKSINAGLWWLNTGLWWHHKFTLKTFLQWLQDEKQQ